MNTKIDELHELIFEVVKGNKPITAIRELVNAGADINARNSRGKNALSVAVSGCLMKQKNTALVVLEEPVKLGADINAPLETGGQIALRDALDCVDVTLNLSLNLLV